MKKEENNYYGIRINNSIPKVDKVNEYSKEIELTFLGTLYLIERKDKEVKKTELKYYDKLKKEGDYELQFINSKNEMYTLQVRIKKSYLFLIFWAILLGVLCGILLSKPTTENPNVFSRFFDLINLSVLEVNIDNEEPIEYAFDVTFENLVSKDVDLQETIEKDFSAKKVAKNKIAPGINGEFSILISTEKSMVDMKYSVNFEDLTSDKPQNLVFKIKGQDKEWSSLQELEKYLVGIAKKNTRTIISIEWRWPYELENVQDTVDTNDGIKLEKYKFKINVSGEEVI